MTTQTETLIADLRGTLAESTPGEWQKGATTHHTVTETGYKIGEFHHARDAQFCDIAHRLMPEIIDMLEAQAKRITKLEAEVLGEQTKMRGVVEAVIEFLETPDVSNQIAGARAYVFILRRALQ